MKSGALGHPLNLMAEELLAIDLESSQHAFFTRE